MPSLERQHVRVFRSHDAADDGGYMPGTPSERLSQMWESTREAWAFFKGGDARDQVADVEKLEAELKRR
ncbi:MAG: hypothetical protein U1F35_23190 [Steroidobacteraceae bacterium]